MEAAHCPARTRAGASAVALFARRSAGDIWEAICFGVRSLWPPPRAVLLCACGDDGDYPEEVVDNFMAGCTAQPEVTKSSCRCSIREIQENVSFEEFQRLKSSITDRNRFPDRLVEAVGACVDELK
jgi:hypothetical protein